MSQEAKIPHKTKWKLLHHKQKPDKIKVYLHALRSHPPSLALPPLISLLPLLLPSPMSYNSPSSPPNYHFHSHNPSLPVQLPPECQYHSPSLKLQCHCHSSLPPYQLPLPIVWWLPTILLPSHPPSFSNWVYMSVLQPPLSLTAATYTITFLTLHFYHHLSVLAIS